jgi:hypothetical protein
MNFELLFSFAERLRVETIGDPIWIGEKAVFEYQNGDVKVVAVLKAIRAAQGIKSLDVLCRNGLFIDMGAIFRCVSDCTAEVYFLLEKYPDKSTHVEQFVRAFFETTIDKHLSTETEPVRTQKIHSAVVRVLTGLEQDQETRSRLLRIYQTFSGYTHANYSHIMQMYGGTYPDLEFKVAGVPSAQQREMYMQLVEQAYASVLHSLAFIAKVFGLSTLNNEILQCC